MEKELKMVKLTFQGKEMWYKTKTGESAEHCNYFTSSRREPTK
jgi:hypothetical protein